MHNPPTNCIECASTTMSDEHRNNKECCSTSTDSRECCSTSTHSVEEASTAEEASTCTYESESSLGFRIQPRKVSVGFATPLVVTITIPRRSNEENKSQFYHPTDVHIFKQELDTEKARTRTRTGLRFTSWEQYSLIKGRSTDALTTTTSQENLQRLRARAVSVGSGSDDLYVMFDGPSIASTRRKSMG